MEFVHTGFQAIFSSAFFLGLILFAALSFGRVLLRRVCGSLETLSAGEGTLFSLALGLAALSLFMLGLGLLGLVTKLHALALLGFFLVLPWWLEKGKRFSFSWASGASIPFLLMLFAFFLSWLNTTLPPIGNDALAYHLADPKDFILHGRVHPIPLSRESLWPYQTEMLFMLGLLLQGTSLAQALHWVFYPLTAFSIYAFGARFLGRREAVFGALVFVFTPVVFALSGEAYVDLGLTFFIFLSFYAFLLKDTLGELKASLVSGLFCGAALATKYSGLNAAVILTVFWLWRKPVSLKSALYFILSALAVSGVWYLRSYWILGNPVYPFFSNFFGGRGFEFGIQSSLGTGNGVDSFLLLLWDMTFYPKLFGGDVLGPFYLLWVPLCLFFVKEFRKPLIFLTVFALLYTLIVFKTAAQVRYFLPALPFLALLAGFSLARLLNGDKAVARLGGALFAAVIALHAGIFVYKARDRWEAVLGAETAEHYLIRKERSYSAYRYLNGTPKNSRIFNAATEPRRFYNQNRFMAMDDANLRLFLADEKRSLPEYLREGDFDFIWVSPFSDPQVHDFIRERAYQKAFSYDFEEGGTPFHYRIYKRP